MFDHEHLARMQEGIELYNEQKYWECHEVFEDLWREDLHDPIRYIYWAVIQVAAACIHYRDNNLIGAQGMIAKAKEKFKHCRDSHILSELAYDKLQWGKFEELAMKIPDSSTSKLEDFREIFDFRFP